MGTTAPPLTSAARSARQPNYETPHFVMASYTNNLPIGRAHTRLSRRQSFDQVAATVPILMRASVPFMEGSGSQFGWHQACIDRVAWTRN